MSETAKLRGTSLFRGLSDAMLEEFLAYFKPTSYAAGDIIFREKAPGDKLYIISEGEVVIEKAMDEAGRDFKTLAILCGGDFFGEMSVIEGITRFAQARASRDTALYEVSRKLFFGFIKEHPETGIGIFSGIVRTLSQRLQHTSSELTMLFTLSRQLLKQHRSPAAFLAAVMEEMHIYLVGSWNIKACSYNSFNEEYEEAYSRETFALESRPLAAAAESGWLDDRTYLMVCAVRGRPLARVLYSNSADLLTAEKNNLATIFNTIGSILSSAMVNIEHQVEAAMLEKLRKSKNTI